jgi:hypothetical protein
MFEVVAVSAADEAGVAHVSLGGPLQHATPSSVQSVPSHKKTLMYCGENYYQKE